MKKLILTAAALFVTLSIYAQGTIDFKNDNTALIMDATDGLAVTQSDGIVVGLYWAPLTDPDNFTQIGASTGINFPPPSPAGRFTGGTRTTGTATGEQGEARFIVRAWEVAYGATYELAVAAAPMGGRPAKVGQSNIIVTKTGGGIGTPGSLLSPGASQPLQPFSVNVPEPTTLALGLIGVGALLLLRRRK